jgi:hypothetical protein
MTAERYRITDDATNGIPKSTQTSLLCRDLGEG